jgi:carbon storage regulator CsrA
MLWLRRKRHESVVIDDGEIEIVIGKIDGDSVRIGIEAPDKTPIMRGEVWLARERQLSSVVDRIEQETDEQKGDNR